MEHFGFAFGMFGIVAFVQSLTLASRVATLESQMARIKGTDNYKLRKNILTVAKSLIGKKVRITQKEEYLNTDILVYSNWPIYKPMNIQFPFYQFNKPKLITVVNKIRIEICECGFVYLLVALTTSKRISPLFKRYQ